MSEKNFNDIDEYSQLVSKRHQTNNDIADANVNPDTVAAALLELDEQGFTVIPAQLESHEVASFKNEILSFMGPTGRHDFEGLKTQRIYSLLQKTISCNKLVEHPMVLSVLDQLLLPNYLLSQAVAINILPGESAQLVHHDDAFYIVQRPRKALSVAAMWALDEFTAENGGTMVIPGSHKWGDKAPTETDLQSAVPVVMSAGSVCLFTGTLWHNGGANNADTSRLGVTAQYCEPWCRTVENCFLSIPLDEVKKCSTRVQSLLGYSLHGPFMGYVDDARHPGLRLKEQ